MDQVRAFLSIVWGQRFWVLSVICTIVAVVCWNMASSDVSSAFTARQGQITQAYKAVQPIKSNTSHPNDDVIQGDTKQAQIQRDMVRKVWEELYQAQRDDVLKWPTDIGEEFVAYMQKRKFGDPISEVMRGFYNNYIENRFDSLLEIVKAKKMAARGGAGGRGGYGGMMGGEGGFGAAAVADPAEDEDYLVDWLDQGQLQQKLMFPGGKPTALQVWVTQEDLWVYETLLKVINQTNQAKNAVRPDNTAVRMIMELQVGAMAASESMGQIIIPQPDAAAGGMMGEGGYGGMMGEGGYGGMMGEGGYGGMMGEGGYGGMMGGEGGYGGMMGGEGGYGGMMGRGGMMGEGGAGGGDATLLMRRYLNAEGKPEEAGSVDTVLASEFRQLPIKMRLMMDEKFIPTILLKCANATLPIEVKQVRINPSKSGGTFGSTNGARGSSNMRGVDQATMATLTEVIIRGAVYIYNEPDTARLTIPGEELAQPGDEVAQAGDGAVLN